MLSVASVGSAGGAAGYYSQEDNYYFLGEASTQWFGKGAEKLGLTGSVEKETFQKVLEGNLPDGSSLVHIKAGQNKHQPGYDLTFSAPKSVSVLALVTGDKEVLAAHQSAVKKTLSEIESFVSTRTMIDGVPVQTNTNNLISALFMHDTSRNLDPQLHTHAIIANATFDPEKGWKTLSSDRLATQRFVNSQGFTNTIFKNQVAFGAIYRQFLKEDLIKQGYEIETVGKNGLWEIKGVPTELFSSRRQEILEATNADAGNRALSVAAKDTRKAKDFSNIDEIKQEWQQKLAETGFDKANIVHQTSAEKSMPGMNITTAIGEAIADIAKNNIKFSYDSLLNNVINRVEVKPGVALEIREAIAQEIQKGELIAVDKEHTYFTTKKHLENEGNVAALLAKVNHETHNLKTNTQSVIANHIANDHKNLNLFAVKGGINYELKLIGELQTLAEENNKKHLIVVPDAKTKFALLEKGERNSWFPKSLVTNWKENIYTAKDFIALEKTEGNLVTVLRAEKISLTEMQGILKTGEQHKDTMTLLDTGGRKETGLTRDIAHEIGINEVQISERNDAKKLVIVDNVDKAARIRSAAKVYTSLAALGKNTILQANQPHLRVQLTETVREMLRNGGILSEQHITLQTRQPVYLDADNMKDRRTYKEGYTLERINNGKSESFKIVSVSGNNKLSLLNEKGEMSVLPMSKINGTYSLFKDSELQVHIGEKLKSTGKFRDITPNKDLTVVGFTKPHFFFREKIILQDGNGKQYTVPTKERMKLDYNYAEPLGASKTGNRDNIVAVLNKVDISSQTVNDIKRGGDNVLMITSANRDTVQKNIKLDDSQVTVTSSLKNLLNADNLMDIQHKAILSANSTFSRLVDAHIEKITLASKDKMVFNAMRVINSVTTANPNIEINEVRAHLAERINKGELISVGSNPSSLSGDFITRENVELERHILNLVKDGKNNAQPILTELDNVPLQGLTQGQKASAGMILTSTDKIMLVQGYAGVGKTTQLRTVANAIHTQRPEMEIIGLAPTHTAVKEMRSAGVNDAITVAEFLKNEAGKTDTKQNEFGNKLFVIDESSMIGNKDMARLLDSIVGKGGRVVLSGDYAQLKAFDSGSPLKLLYERGVLDKSVMSEIVRQEATLKPAVEYAIKGAVPRALVVIMKNEPDIVARRDITSKPAESVIDVKEIETHKTYSMIAADFVGRTQNERDNTIVITPLNADRHNLNQAIHNDLKNNGDLGEKSLRIPVYEQINATKADIKDPSFWEKRIDHIVKQGEQYFRVKETTKEGMITLSNMTTGEFKLLDSLHLNQATTAIYRAKYIEINENDKVRITATDRERVVSNNAFGVIEKIEENKVFINTGGKTVIYNPLKENADRHLDYGYAITDYASQGGSHKNVIMYIDNPQIAALDSFYVQISRAKVHIQAYINDVVSYVDKTFSNSGERPTATDILEGKNVFSEAQKVLDVRLEWQNSSKLEDAKFSHRLPENLVENSHYVSEKSEIILQVLNENGSHRGNYHLPVNPYRGEINFEKGYYQGANDGSFIVLNQGDEQKEVRNYTLSELDKAILNNDQEHSVVIKLHDQEERLTDVERPIDSTDTFESAVEIYDELQIQEEKSLGKDADEIIREERNEQAKEVESEQVNRLGNDEVNILHHHQPEPNQEESDKGIKEKEYI